MQNYLNGERCFFSIIFDFAISGSITIQGTCSVADLIRLNLYGNAGPSLTNDNPHTLTVPYSSGLQYCAVSVCGLSLIRVGPVLPQR